MVAFVRGSRLIAAAVSAMVVALVLGPPTASSAGRPHRTGLAAPREKQIAMELVSSAENSTLDWRREYGYIQDIGDGRGYTAGLIGFCSGTGDMLAVVRSYVRAEPSDPLARFLPALRRVNGTASHRGLGRPFVRAWKLAARDPVFRRMQMRELDRVYFDPAVRRAKRDGLGTLGQFIYYDAIVMHGDGWGDLDFSSIRQRALNTGVRPPAQGGDEIRWLHAFLDARAWTMKQEPAHEDTSRVDTAQRRFLNEGKLNLERPLQWHVYGQQFDIR